MSLNEKQEFLNTRERIAEIVAIMNKRNLTDDEHAELYTAYIVQADALVDITGNASFAKVYLQLASSVHASRMGYFVKQHPDDFIPETYPFETTQDAMAYVKACEMTSSYGFLESFVQKRVVSLQSLKKIKDAELKSVLKPSADFDELQTKKDTLQKKMAECTDAKEKTSIAKDFTDAIKALNDAMKVRSDAVVSEGKRAEIARLTAECSRLQDEIKIWDEQCDKVRKFKMEANLPSEKAAIAAHHAWLHKEAKKCQSKHELAALKLKSEEDLKKTIAKAAREKELEVNHGKFDPRHFLSFEDIATAEAKQWNIPPSTATCNVKEGEVVSALTPLVWLTVDSSLCSACGTTIKKEDRVVCAGACKGENCGWYCSKVCLDSEADVHARLCGSKEFAESAVLVHSAVVRGGMLDPLVFMLYYKIVAWGAAKKVNFVDHPILRSVVFAGHRVAGDNLEKDAISQQLVETQYVHAIQTTGLNILDPKNDFWIHSGLYLGLRMYALPTFSDRTENQSLCMEEGDTRETLIAIPKAGIGLYPTTVWSAVSCLPSVDIENCGKKGQPAALQLRALRDLKKGDVYSISYVNPSTMDAETRQTAMKFRTMKCGPCELCRAQQVAFPSHAKQIRIMQEAMVAAARLKLEAQTEEAREQTEAEPITQTPLAVDV